MYTTQAMWPPPLSFYSLFPPLPFPAPSSPQAARPIDPGDVIAPASDKGPEDWVQPPLATEQEFQVQTYTGREANNLVIVLLLVLKWDPRLASL